MSTQARQSASRTNYARILLRRLELDGLVVVKAGWVEWMHDDTVSTTLTFTREDVQRLVEIVAAVEAA